VAAANDDETLPLTSSGGIRAGPICRVGVLSGAGIEIVDLPATGTVTFGRSVDASIHLGDASVSRLHARLVMSEDGPTLLEDLGSNNGTYLGGVRLPSHAPTEVPVNAIVRLGSVRIAVLPPSPTSCTVLEVGDFEVALRAAVSASAVTGDEVAEISARWRDPRHRKLVFEELFEQFPEAEAICFDGSEHLRMLTPVTSARDASRMIERLAHDLGPRVGELRIGATFLPDSREQDLEETLVLDPAMHRVHALARQFAAGTISVLVCGETGVGKESVAAEIHRRSTRASGPYIRLHCAALSETLLESELFGHERGAFTGAVGARAGLLETASGGTLFLDEIGEMSAGAQAKLLRCVEEGTVTRLGGNRPIKVDPRFVAATNRDLLAEVRAGRFRQDLYYRVAAATIDVPPLRERSSEIIPLAERFARQFWAKLGRLGTPQLSPAVGAALRACAWPGNVRELRNVMERAVLLANGIIDVEHLPIDRLRAPVEPVQADPPPAATELRDRLLQALATTGGNQTRAARQLGISRVTFGRWLDQAGLPRPRK
jgi:two-component system, NtrC family, response regulator AtoC